LRNYGAVFALALLLLSKLRPSSYHYSCGVLQRPVKHAKLRLNIIEIARASYHGFGSPLVWLSLHRPAVRVSEKFVRRLIKEERVSVFYTPRKRRYSSYEGETSLAPVDCFDGKVLAWRTFHHSDKFLTQGMFEDAIGTIP
jgi:hypothetical protein